MICFLDRDGIFNVDYGYVGTLDRFRWQPDIFPILKYLKRLGYTFVLVTNQSGIGRRYYSLHDFFHLSFYMMNYLYDYHDIDLEINFCPHAPSANCICRKPSPQMILRYPIHDSDIMIGDNSTDMDAAYSAGVPHRWLISSNPSGLYTECFDDLSSLLSVLPVLLTDS